MCGLASGSEARIGLRQLGAVAQQEEQQVQHDAEADEEFEGVLADRHGVGGDHLAALGGRLRDLLDQAFDVAEAEAVEQAERAISGWR